MTDKEMVIDISKISKRFGSVIALNRLSLAIPNGVFGLIGPNGAGKTTLIRILLGLLRPDEGEATILGHNIRTESVDIRSKSGVLHEHPVFPKSLQVGQYLHHVSKLYDNHKDQDELLSTVGLDIASKMKIGNLSAGMQQRLGIAQALIGNPQLLFLDEPTSNLDVIGRWDLLQRISVIHQELGITVVISSHVLSELEKVCTHVGFLNKGSLVEKGSIFDVLQKYSANHLRISLQNPSSIIEEVQRINGVETVEISGTNSLTVGFNDVTLDDIHHGVAIISERLGMTVHSFEPVSSLELAFREVVKNG